MIDGVSVTKHDNSIILIYTLTVLRSTYSVFAFLNPCMPSIAPDSPIVCEFCHQSNLIIITDLYSWDRGIGDR